MFKLYSLGVVILAFLTSAQGHPVSPPAPHDEILNAVKAGDWSKVESLIIKGFGEDHRTGFTLGGVKELKPPKGGHVYGESEYTFQASSDINGQKLQKSGGHKVINDDGKVNEFDFNPELDVDAFFDKLRLKSHEVTFS